jgi:hypothetical protein
MSLSTAFPVFKKVKRTFREKDVIIGITELEDWEA